jgi:hypothetical protein
MRWPIVNSISKYYMEQVLEISDRKLKILGGQEDNA